MLNVEDIKNLTLPQHLEKIRREDSMGLKRCSNCEHVNLAPFKPKQGMDENESFLYDIYLSMPKPPTPEQRTMIPFKTDGIWHYLCARCV